MSGWRQKDFPQDGAVFRGSEQIEEAAKRIAEQTEPPLWQLLRFLGEEVFNE